MESSPRDLSVLFRSLPRRQEEALGDVAPSHPAVVDLVGQIDARVARAAADIGVDPELVADELVARPAAAWNDEELSALRDTALEIGRLLRSLSAAADDVDVD